LDPPVDQRTGAVVVPAGERQLKIGHRFSPAVAALERDDFSLNRHPAPASRLSMIFSENRCTPRIKSGAGFFGIMLLLEHSHAAFKASAREAAIAPDPSAT